MLGRLTPQRRHLHSNSKPVLITSPIFYVNAVPHIGHLYSAVLADTLKRWYALKGHEALYSTGTDEHGLKIQEAARKAKQDPKEFCDAISHKFKVLFDSANVSYTRFIRTTDSDHYTAVDAIWRKLVQNGYIYKGTHEGWYSISDETFYPATQVEAVKDVKTGVETMKSKESGKPVEWTVEENYKFRLGDLKERLVEWLEANPDAILPKAQYLNVLNTLKSTGEESLGDISVSRPSSRLQWGIPVPDDPSHVIYVWLDALTNYLTVAGYPWLDAATQAKSAWPVQWHVVGKDIVKFHAIYWPAFLMAADLPLPKHIISHAHWLQGKTKMSKSLGNVTDPHALIETFGGVDPVRYFLMRDGGIEYDADFSKDMVMKRYRELSNQLGNLALRCSGEKVNAGQCIPLGPGKGGYGQSEEKLLALLNQIRDRVTSTFENAQFSNGLESIITLVNEANGYWGDQKPWVLADQISSNSPEAAEAREKLQTALYLSFEAMRVAAILLQPVMPSKMETLLSWMGVDGKHTSWDCAVLSGGEARKEAVRLSKLEPLFPKSNEYRYKPTSSRTIPSSSSPYYVPSASASSAPSVRQSTPNKVRVTERSSATASTVRIRLDVPNASYPSRSNLINLDNLSRDVADDDDDDDDDDVDLTCIELDEQESARSSVNPLKRKEKDTPSTKTLEPRSKVLPIASEPVFEKPQTIHPSKPLPDRVAASEHSDKQTIIVSDTSLTVSDTPPKTDSPLRRLVNVRIRLPGLSPRISNPPFEPAADEPVKWTPAERWAVERSVNRATISTLPTLENFKVTRATFLAQCTPLLYNVLHTKPLSHASAPSRKAACWGPTLASGDIPVVWTLSNSAEYGSVIGKSEVTLHRPLSNEDIDSWLDGMRDPVLALNSSEMRSVETAFLRKDSAKFLKCFHARNLLMTSANGGVHAIWDLDDESPFSKAPGLLLAGLMIPATPAMDISKNDQLVAVSYTNGSTYIWNMNQDRIGEKKLSNSSVLLHPDHSSSKPGQNKRISALCFNLSSSSYPLIALAYRDRVVFVDSRTKRHVHSQILQTSTSPVTAMHWSEVDGNMVATGNAAGEVKIWDVRNITGGAGKLEPLPVCTFYVDAPASESQPAVDRPNPVAVEKVEWSPHCKGILLATRADGTVTLYSSTKRYPFFTHEHHRGTPIFSTNWNQDPAHEGLIMSAANLTAEDTSEATVQLWRCHAYGRERHGMAQ
ncbi:methionyl-tRNA synthetase [Chytriomyces hyalinus]|nr:methionyl-tRNA synthetase [Chytriomyces hyalinus]